MQLREVLLALLLASLGTLGFLVYRGDLTWYQGTPAASAPPPRALAPNHYKPAQARFGNDQTWLPSGSPLPPGYRCAGGDGLV